ncbi:MAG: transcription termination/antitermination factor NusG [Candidatus Cloacimonadota bacterium]|nr:MAG: transcription termination/antitermination factor NusG [Candidatus Cloacimonadota bacterium]
MKKWYIVHVFTGQEKKVKRVLEERIALEGKKDEFGYVYIPVENVAKIKNRQKVVTEKRIYPGYVVIEMEPADENFRLIRNTAGVMDFLGSDNPQTLSDEEVQRMLNIMETKVNRISREIPFQQGDAVRIIDGPFIDFNASVEDVYPDREKAKVIVTIFGRSTPVELSFYQIKLL